ncbi:MAG: branched-chain amino acid ABC transporter permease, partial [Promethearchaeota archaeon]
ISLIISAAFGYIISIPAVKLRADYFAIMTIAGGEVVRLVLLYEERWLWAPLPPPIPAKTQLISSDLKIEFTDKWYPFNLKLSEYTPYDITIFRDIGRFIEDSGWGPIFVWEITLLIIFIVISLITYWFVQQIRNSPYGRTLRAIREDDITVTSVGKDVARFRWQVTTISALLCGMAGVMYAIAFGALDAADFKPVVTFQLYMFIIIGGLGNSRGSFIGTTLVTIFLRGAQVPAVKDNIQLNFSPESPLIGPILDFLQLNIFINPFNLRFVVLGGILILFLLFMPAGLIPEPRTDNERYLSMLTSEQRARSDEAVLARQSLTERERIEAEKESKIELLTTEK